MPRAVLWGLLSLNLLALLMASLTLQRSLEHYREQAFVATRNIAQLLERDLAADLERMDLILLDVQAEVERQMAQGGLQPDVLTQLLNRRSYRLDERDALRVADTQGHLVYGLAPEVAATVQVADRPYFKSLRAGPAPRLFISPPLLSRVTGEWTLVLARRVNQVDGEFAGVVYLALRLATFEQRFASLDLGRSGAVSLRDAELRLLARYSVAPQEATPVGTQRVSADLKAALERAPQLGDYVATTALDGVERANSYRRLPGHPFLVIVGLATDDFLGRWRNELMLTVLLMGCFMGISLRYAWHLRASWARREQDLQTLASRESDLRASEQRFRLLVQGVHDHAIYMLSPQGVVLSWNDGAERLKLWTAEEVMGRHFSMFYPQELVALGRPDQHLAEAARTGHATVEEVRVRKNAQRFWAAVTITALHDAEGRLTGFAKLTRDVTDAKRVEIQERRRRRVLELMLAEAPMAETLAEVLTGLRELGAEVSTALLLSSVTDTRLSLVAEQPEASGWRDHLLAHPLDSTPLWLRMQSDSTPCMFWEDGPQQPPWCRQAWRDLALQSLLLWPIGRAGEAALGVVLVGVGGAGHERTALAAMVQEAAEACHLIVQRARSREALELAASVYQAIGDAILVAGAEGRVLAINPAFHQLTGYTAAALLGRSYEHLVADPAQAPGRGRMELALEATGRWQGEVLTRFAHGESRPQWWMVSTIDDAQGVPLRRVVILSELTDKKRAEEQAWIQANYDPLTGLPHRRLFMDRLGQALKGVQQGRECLTLMLVDLDHFKQVNDQWGHEAGDAVLREAADRITHCVRSTDTVARWGGDEFTVLVSGVQDPARALALADLMVKALSRPIRWGEVEARIGASIGLCQSPRDGLDATTLLGLADQAMYRVKRAGRSGACLHQLDNPASASLISAHKA